MPIFGLIVLVLFFVFGVPIARALSERVSTDIRSGRRPEPDVELRRELELTQSLLSDTQSRLTEVERRLDFYEKLLEERRPPRLGRGTEPGPHGS